MSGQTGDRDAAREAWREAAGGWDRWGPAIQRQYGAASRTMLDMAGVGPGCRVLDVAAGPGYQTVEIARRIGAEGHVLATDISAEMLAVAERNVAAAGHANAAFRVMDAMKLDAAPGSFDAAICRHSLMIFPDPSAALAGMRSSLVPGGRVGLTVLTTPERNRFLSQPEAIIRRRLALPAPAPDRPGLFRLGGPGVLETLLMDAGFADIETTTIETPQLLDSARAHVAYLKDVSRVLVELLAGTDEATAGSVWREIESAAAAFEDESGFRGPCEVMVASAARP